jgi:hypothetical protein
MVNGFRNKRVHFGKGSISKIGHQGFLFELGDLRLSVGETVFITTKTRRTESKGAILISAILIESLLRRRTGWYITQSAPATADVSQRH